MPEVGVKPWQRDPVLAVEQVIVACHELARQGVHILLVGDRHVQQAAAGQEAADLVEPRQHVGPAVAVEAGLEQIALDLHPAAQLAQHLAQELQPQGLAEQGAGTAGELEAEVVVVRLVTAEGVERGEMIAEFGREVEVVGADQGIAVAARFRAEFRGGRGGQAGEKTAAVKLDGAAPVDARMGKTAPQRLDRG